MSQVTIWHHTSCGSSKGALEYLKSKGLEPTVYLYMKEKPGKAELQAVLQKLGMKPSELLRPGEKKGEELGLYHGASEEAILQAMSEHPILIQRPVVITEKGAVLARPKSKMDSIL
jgi:arsenate reductase